MNIKILKAAVTALVLFVSGFANAGLLFTFIEDSENVIMSSSGSIDTRGLVLGNSSSWSGTGIEENGNHDILGDTSFGAIDTSFGFNSGTDYSQWASTTGPWVNNLFSFNVTSGSKSFSTYIFGSIQVPGLGIRAEDLVGNIWTADQNWLVTEESFNSLGLITGTYTVNDALSNEFITFQIGRLISIPEPSTLAIFGLALIGLASRKLKNNNLTVYY